MKSLDDDSHVSTRICQYEALKSEKGVYIAKQLNLARLNGQNEILKKYGLKQYDFSAIEKIKALKYSELARLRPRLMCLEARFSEEYFIQIFSLIPVSLRPESRKTFKAYDGINNIFNLAYEMLSWKVHHAIIKAKLSASDSLPKG